MIVMHHRLILLQHISLCEAVVAGAHGLRSDLANHLGTFYALLMLWLALLLSRAQI